MDELSVSGQATGNVIQAIAWPEPLAAPRMRPEQMWKDRGPLAANLLKHPFPGGYQTRAPDPLPGRSIAIPRIDAALAAEVSP